jgi:signal transduction histidine kinase
MRGYLLSVVLAAVSVLLLVFVIPVLLLIQRDLHDRMALSAMRLAVELLPEAQRATPPVLPPRPDDGYLVSILTVPEPSPPSSVVGARPAAEPASARPSAAPQPTPTPAPAGADSPAVRDALRSCRGTTVETSDAVEVALPVRDATGCHTVVRVVASEKALRAHPVLFTLLTLTLAAAAALFAVFLADRVARGLLRSVSDLALAADDMARGVLDARVAPSGPAEIQRVGHQLNHLAKRVGQLLDERSQRSADLTHRLRTPLTALRLDMDALPDSPATRRVLADYRMVTKAVDEVIHLARHARLDTTRRQTADVTRVARERVEFWAALAEDTGRSVWHNIPREPIFVHASRSELEATFDAILGNIFAHTPSGVPFWVDVLRVPDEAAVVRIDDAGPGFPDLSVIGRGKSGAASTGLGLDIARQTAEASGGALYLRRSPRGGARVEIWFGAARAYTSSI